MKKLLILLFIISPIVSNAQRKPKIKGSRIVTQVSEELPPFNAIVLNDDLEINLDRSFGPGYHITADDNLIDILKFEVEDGTLVISSYYDITAKKELEITVNYTELKAITLKSGSIISKSVIETDELFVDGFNNTKMDLKANASVMDINLEDTSSGDFHVEVDSLNINLNKRTQAYVYAQINTGLLDLDGNSSLTMEGTSDRLQVNMLDHAKYKGEGMQVSSCQLHITGNANARVYAFNDIEIAATGGAGIYLYGTPHITIKEFLDTAQLIKKE
ncbi:MAG: GIN domain-containing protein [Allomuricauda sp.]